MALPAAVDLMSGSIHRDEEGKALTGVALHVRAAILRDQSL